MHLHASHQVILVLRNEVNEDCYLHDLNYLRIFAASVLALGVFVLLRGHGHFL